MSKFTISKRTLMLTLAAGLLSSGTAFAANQEMGGMSGMGGKR